MAAGFKKILLSGDAAELSDDNPADVANAASAGVGTTASRDDHVHAIAADAVGADEIDSTDTGITMAQLIFTPAANGTGEVEGTVFYDSDDDHLYVYTGA